MPPITLPDWTRPGPGPPSGSPFEHPVDLSGPHSFAACISVGKPGEGTPALSISPTSLCRLLGRLFAAVGDVHSARHWSAAPGPPVSGSSAAPGGVAQRFPPDPPRQDQLGATARPSNLHRQGARPRPPSPSTRPTSQYLFPLHSRYVSSPFQVVSGCPSSARGGLSPAPPIARPSFSGRRRGGEGTSGVPGAGLGVNGVG